MKSIGSGWVAVMAVAVVGGVVFAEDSLEVQLLRSFSTALSESDRVPPEEQQALLEIVVNQLSAQDVPVPLDRMSEVRKARLAQHLSRPLERYPRGPYNTVLQRAAYREQFRNHLATYFTWPVVKPYGDAERRDQQIEELAAALAESFADLVVEEDLEYIRRGIKACLIDRRDNDRDVCMKGPLPEKEYEKVLVEIARLAEEHGRTPSGEKAHRAGIEKMSWPAVIAYATRVQRKFFRVLGRIISASYKDAGRHRRYREYGEKYGSATPDSALELAAAAERKEIIEAELAKERQELEEKVRGLDEEPASAAPESPGAEAE
jgi:hypothetical protein